MAEVTRSPIHSRAKSPGHVENQRSTRSSRLRFWHCGKHRKQSRAVRTTSAVPQDQTESVPAGVHQSDISIRRQPIQGLLRRVPRRTYQGFWLRFGTSHRTIPKRSLGSSSLLGILRSSSRDLVPNTVRSAWEQSPKYRSTRKSSRQRHSLRTADSRLSKCSYPRRYSNKLASQNRGRARSQTRSPQPVCPWILLTAIVTVNHLIHLATATTQNILPLIQK